MNDARKVFLGGVLLTLAVTISFFPFLLGNQFFLDSDLTNYFYPIYHTYHQALAEKANFLWDPLLLSGYPTYVSQSGGLLDPANLLIFRFLDARPGLHLRLFIDYLCIVFFSYLAGRSFNLSPLASSLIGLGFILGLTRNNITNPSVASSLFLLPLLFYVSNKLFGIHPFRYAILGGFGVGWAILSGNAQFILYSLCTVSFFFAFLFWIHYRQNRVGIWRSVAAFLLLILLGLAIASPQILAVVSFTSLTVRSGGLDYAAATNKVIGLNQLINFVLPDYLYFPYLGVGRYGLYIGIFWFLMFLSALPLVRRSQTVAFLYAFFGLIFLASIQYSPLFYLLHKVPVFNLLRSPSRWMFLGVFLMSLLAGFGFDRLSRERIRLGIWSKVAAVFLCVSLVSVFLVYFGGSPLKDFAVGSAVPAASRFMPEKSQDYYQEILGEAYDVFRATVSLGNINFMVPFLLIYVAAFLLYLYLSSAIESRAFRRTGFILSIATFISIFLIQGKTSVAWDFIPPHSPVSYLEDYNSSEWRFFPFLLYRARSEQFQSHFVLSPKAVEADAGAALLGGLPNLNELYGISSIDGYEPFMASRWIMPLAKLGSIYGIQAEETHKLGKEPEALLAENLNLLSMMNARYVISGVSLAIQGLELKKTLFTPQYKLKLYLYENKNALPRFYWARSVVFLKGPDAGTVLNSVNDFEQSTFIECSDCFNGKGSLRPGSISPLTIENGRYHLETKNDSTGWLVLSESNLPGWKADIDGAGVPIFRANELYMAVEVPSGVHSVDFHYEGIRGEAKLFRQLGIIKP